MKLWNVEISKLKNEWLLKGKKQTSLSKKLLLAATILFSVLTFVLFCVFVTTSENSDKEFLAFFLLVVGAAAIGYWVAFLHTKRILQECEEVIENRLESGYLKAKEVEKALRPKTKEEKRSIAIKIGCFAVIFVIVLYISIACSISKRDRGYEYDDVFKKDPNNWSDDEKDYVNDLFDYMKENN